MNLESPTVTIEKSATYLYTQLTDVNNFQKLMPSNIDKFEVLTDAIFKFSLKGMPEIKLQLKDSIPYSRIAFSSTSEKLPFNLLIHVNSISDNSCHIKLNFESEFNTMMTMMTKGPISKFIEALSDNMIKL
jgi:hypothetical protein